MMLLLMLMLLLTLFHWSTLIVFHAVGSMVIGNAVAAADAVAAAVVGVLEGELLGGLLHRIGLPMAGGGDGLSG